ncbi:GLIPR1-like protein 1 [Menidia menidia]
MGSTVKMLPLFWVVLDLGVYSLSLPEISDSKFIDECVTEHNIARSSVNPPATNMLYMTWDQGLAITARAWARHCVFEHNIHLKDVRRMHPVFPSVGENIWTGYPPSHFNVSVALKSWVNEKEYYDYQTTSCTKICGHYTQVVWASSYKVGCAVELCPKGVRNFSPRKGAIFVCNYATTGNFRGQKPYQSQGEPCSACEGTCDNSLCRNQERDAQRSYNWEPDWDPANTANDSSYVVVLIARPIALILTFIAAYAVCYFYPNVFCYE